MNAPPPRPTAGDPDLDVLIVGAGLSGIGAARHLQQRCPEQRWAILEARGAIGGTWDLFRYPGVRSDSDMYTLGYIFKPWRDAKAIADGPAILAYIREAADEAGITPQIRFGHRVRRADWSSDEACWTVQIERDDAGGAPVPVTLRTRLLHLCAGYYSYAQGYRPEIAGEADFRGRIVHPQFWPKDLDHAGRRVVVIGSGATAVTLVPEMARTAAQVTMLQRSPTYCVTRPSEDKLANWMNRHLPARAAYALTRWKNVLLGAFFFRLARGRPEGVKRHLVEMAQRQLGTSCDASVHFAPHYKPWDQRVCLVPDGDLFRQIRKGRAEVVTGSIDRFTADGIRLADGRELPAEIVVLATGLELNVLGDIALAVDGRPVDVGRCLSYKGMMLSDVPNLVATFGYTNASWTLKADLTAQWVCRLLQYMRRHGYRSALPRRDPAMAERPLLDFTSGYVLRAHDRIAKQGTRAPWRVRQSYLADLLSIRWGRVADGTLRFDARAAGR